jgi:hypothetical protein
MNKYEAIVKMSKKIEVTLDLDFGAEGKGMIEKARNVEHLLSPDLFYNICKFGRIRNKLMHEDEFDANNMDEVICLSDVINDALFRESKLTNRPKEENEQDEWQNYCRNGAVMGKYFQDIFTKYILPGAIGIGMLIVWALYF